MTLPLRSRVSRLPAGVTSRPFDVLDPCRRARRPDARTDRASLTPPSRFPRRFFASHENDSILCVYTFSAQPKIFPQTRQGKPSLCSHSLLSSSICRQHSLPRFSKFSLSSRLASSKRPDGSSSHSPATAVLTTLSWPQRLVLLPHLNPAIFSPVPSALSCASSDSSARETQTGAMVPL